MESNEKKAVNILISPCKAFIVNNIADSRGTTIRALQKDMVSELVKMSTHVQEHLAELRDDNVIMIHGDELKLTEEGKIIYERMLSIAQGMKLHA